MSRNSCPQSPGGGGSSSGEGGLSRRRKKRTSIDTSIRVALEKSFLGNPKPTSEDISLIADSLNMEKEVVITYLDKMIMLIKNSKTVYEYSVCFFHFTKLVFTGTF